MKHILSIKCIVAAALVLSMLALQSFPAAATARKPLTENDLLRLLKGGVYSGRIVTLVRERGIAFSPTRRNLDLLEQAGANDDVRRAVLAARRLLASADANANKPRYRRQLSQSNPSLAPARPVNTLNIHQREAPSPNARSVTLPPGKTPSRPAAVIAQQTPGLTGVTITMRNWKEYQQYMPAGMIALFEGSYFWKAPADIEIRVGPTIAEHPAAGYLEATARYSGNVRVVHLANGHNDIQNYYGGEPFPNPQEPDKGYKLLADLWFAYVPHLLAGTLRNPLRTCSETRHGFINCVRMTYVLRQVAYNTDFGIPTEEKTGQNDWYTEWFSIDEPEELKYTTWLKLYSRDNQRAPELYTYLPSLRRWIRGSLAARCTPITGTDYLEDDYRAVGFNGGIGSFQARFLRHQRMLALAGDYSPLGGDFPENYYMPFGWPKPSWGKWQLRDVDVIDVRRVPGEEAGYCYGKRIIYEDSDTHYALWEDGYDSGMRFWKTALLAQRTVQATMLGKVPGALSVTAWDVKYDHLTVSSTEGRDGGDVAADYDVPGQYNSLTSYSTPAGLAEIMK
ncbi:MAG TPA: DUF1329 domain-containing protein [Candidatus Binataceae bacterium]|nr:DUF1329 domain-containing protein [Candidatus Binataceae bacterium]